MPQRDNGLAHEDTRQGIVTKYLFQSLQHLASLITHPGGTHDIDKSVTDNKDGAWFRFRIRPRHWTSHLSSLFLLVWTDLGTCRYWLVAFSFLGVDLQSPRLSLFLESERLFKPAHPLDLIRLWKVLSPEPPCGFPGTKSSPNISCLAHPTCVLGTKASSRVVHYLWLPCQCLVFCRFSSSHLGCRVWKVQPWPLTYHF